MAQGETNKPISDNKEPRKTDPLVYRKLENIRCGITESKVRKY